MVTGEPGGPRLVSEGPFFAQLWEAVLFDKRLSPSAVRVYGCLQRYAAELGADAVFPSQEAIGDRIGMDRDTVSAALVLLAETGHISRERQGRGWIVTIKTPARRAGKSRTSDTRKNPAGSAEESRTSDRDTRKNPADNAEKSRTNRESEGVTQSKETPQTPQGAVEDRFPEYWALVVRREPGKTKARDAWDKALKRGADPQDIIDGMAAARPVHLAAEDKTKVPHATTWLNQSRWEEVPAAPGDAPDYEPARDLSPEEVEEAERHAAARRAERERLAEERRQYSERLARDKAADEEAKREAHERLVAEAEQDPERPSNVPPNIWAYIDPERRPGYAQAARRQQELEAEDAAREAARTQEESAA